MLYHNHTLYQKVRTAKLDGCQLKGALRELCEWTCEEYSVNVLHVEVDSIGAGPHQGRPRLCLIVESSTDREALALDAFRLEQRVLAALQRKYIDLVEPDAPAVPHVTVDCFSQEAVARAVGHFLASEREVLGREFPDLGITEISGFSTHVAIFYGTDQDVVGHRATGASSRVEARCRDLIAKYDEFSYTRVEPAVVKFDSRQNLDRSYAGSLFYYWR